MMDLKNCILLLCIHYCVKMMLCVSNNGGI